MIRIFLFSFSIIIVSFAREDRTKPWFASLPNEKLDGVPASIKQLEKQYPAVKMYLVNSIGRTVNASSTINEARRQKRTQKSINPMIPFPCNVTFGRSPGRPISVHALRPGDIDVVAAMGDSLTAGNGAFAINVFHLATENRGVCSFIGGQGTWREHLTLPNILKEFNPNLIGYSLGDSYTYDKGSQFNVAEFAAMGQDMPFMAQQLVKRIKRDPRIDFKNDWKLVTLLIGSNNFCSDICYLQNSSEAVKNQRRDLMKSLKYLQDNLPRTIINWVQSPNLKFLTEFKNAPTKCQYWHLFECPCLFGRQFESRRKEFFATMEAWQRMEEEVANDQQFRKKDDFTVVLQTCLKKLTSPLLHDKATGQMKTDTSYMSYDCFHLSQKGYARLSNSIWNNLLEPVGSKMIDTVTEFQKIMCPTEKCPYIYTWKNSKN